MSCQACGSDREREFAAEINFRFCGLTNINDPGVLVFPKLLACLDCGVSRFTLPETRLALLASGALRALSQPGRHSVDHIARRSQECA
jgi:hypothetical protein